jgi:hypothetical protein
VYRSMDDIVAGNEAQLKFPLLAPSFGSTVPELNTRGRVGGWAGAGAPGTPAPLQPWTPVTPAVLLGDGAGGGGAGASGGTPASTSSLPASAFSFLTPGATAGGRGRRSRGAASAYAPLPTAATLLALKQRLAMEAGAASVAAPTTPGALSPLPTLMLPPTPGGTHRPGTYPGEGAQAPTVGGGGLGVRLRGPPAVPPIVNRQPSDLDGAGAPGPPGVGAPGAFLGRGPLFQEPSLPPLPDSDGSVGSDGCLGRVPSSSLGPLPALPPSPAGSLRHASGPLPAAAGPSQQTQADPFPGVGPIAGGRETGSGDGAPAPTPVGDARLCTVCCAGEKNCAIVPCGHTFCRPCVDKVQVCPICRSEKTMALNLFA